MDVGKGQEDQECFLLTSVTSITHIEHTAKCGTTEGCRTHTIQQDTQYLKYHNMKNVTYCTENKQQF